MADFDEEWSKVADGVLTIRWYYFPTTQSLKIKCEDIKQIKIVSQAKSWEKNWGSSDLHTWWACDMKRNFRIKPEEFYNVKIDVGECFKKGFTVKDANAFVYAIRKHSKMTDIVVQ